MSKIKLYGATSGYVELTPPAVAPDETWTLGDASKLTSGTLPKARFPAGTILQVVNSQSTTYTVIATSTPTDVGLSVSITPSSASNKIMVMASGTLAVERAASSAQDGFIRLMRDSTELIESFITKITAQAGSYHPVSLTWLDSPATTSSVTYKVQAYANATSSSGLVRWGGLNSAAPFDTKQGSITVIEVAG